MAAPPVEGRALGNFERYNVMKINLGHPNILAWCAKLPSANTNTTTQRLPMAISHLLAQHPLLSAFVADRYSRNPVFATRTVQPEEIVTEPPPDAGGDSSDDRLLERVMKEGKRMDIERGPLWAVSIVPGTPVKVTLAISHLLGDGTSSRNLFAELLRLLSLPNVPPIDASSTTLPPVLPPTVEETLKLRPPAKLLVHAVVYELIAPALPKAIRPAVKPYFPNPPPLYQDHFTSVRTVNFSFETITSLKSIGKANGVATLQPILNTIACGALALALSSSNSRPFGSIPLRSSTPISLRDSALGHPKITGNYVAMLSLYERMSPTSMFFAHSRLYAKQLKSKAGRRLALGEVGLLSLVPNPKVKQGAKETGWEKLFGEAAKSDTPFRCSILVSNLGVMSLPKELADVEVIWSQTVTPIMAPMFLNVISTTNGMTISCVSLDACLKKGLMDQVWANFEVLVHKIAEGEVVEATLMKDMLAN